MRFVRAEIFGFGKWVDKTFDFTNNLLVCLYGENEAGKSTLQQFILFMLFGLPPRKRIFYQPKHSHRIGGMLTIDDKEIGVYTIKRVDDQLQCLLPNGVKQDESWLRERLKGMTSETYMSIYAFSASDLSEIRNMKSEQLSDVLFSVSLTGATKIYQVEKKLEAKVGELFKKTGRIPLINKQLKTIEDIYIKLVKAKKQEATYHDKKIEYDTLQAKINKQQTYIESVQEKLRYYEKLHDFIPLLNDYHESKEKLSVFPENMTFPENGVNRYQTAKNKLIPLKSEREILRKNKQQYKEQLTSLAKELYPDTVYDDVKFIFEEKQRDEKRQVEIDDKESELAHLHREIKDQLHRVNVTIQEVEDTVFPFHVEETWREIRDTNILLQQEAEQLAEDHELISQEFQRLINEEEALNRNILSDNEIADLEQKIKEYDFIRSVNDNRTEQQNNWDLWKRKQKNQLKWTISGTVFSAFLSIFITVFVQSYLLFIVPAIIIIVGGIQVYHLRNDIIEMEKRIKTSTMQPNIRKSEREKYSKLLEETKQFKNDLQAIQREKKRMELEKMKWDERKRLFDQKENKWVDRLNKEQHQYPFLSETDPAHWPELLQKIRHTQQLLLERKERQTELDRLHEEHQLFSQQIEVFSKAINIETASITIKQLQEILEIYKTNMRLIKQYERLLEENETKESDLQIKIKAYQDELDELLSVANSVDEEDFYKKARNITEQEELLQKKSSIEQRITSTFPKEVIEMLLTEEMDPQQIELTIVQLQEQLSSLQSSITEMNKQLAAIETEMKQMEVSENYSKVKFHYQIEKDKLTQLAEEWAVVQVALTALSHAKRTYQKKYLTEVIRLTSTYFQILTNHKYKQVFAPTSTKLFQVEADNYMRYTVDELSQGTIDQLYVSLRLAISSVMSKKFIFPLILDDAFVHFDDKRTDQALHLVKEIAKNQQILFFTCKKDIADKLLADHVLEEINV